jgi:hypothetical protein
MVRKGRKFETIFLVFFIVIGLLCSSIPVFSFNQQVTASANESPNESTYEQGNSQLIFKNISKIDESQSNLTNNSYINNPKTVEKNLDPQLAITYPIEGYFYFPTYEIKNTKPILDLLNYCVIIDSVLRVEINITGIDHVRFEAIKIFTGQKTVKTQYNLSDSYTCSLSLTTGVYKIMVIGYDKNETELKSDSIKVFFIRSLGQREDFGIWIRTEYQNNVVNTKINIRPLDFLNMMQKKEWRTYTIEMEQAKDTTIDLRFTRDETVIVEGENVSIAQVQFNLHTTCNTINGYSVSLEARIPTSFLNNNLDMTSSFTTGVGEPYFAARVGFLSPVGNMGPHEVNTRFCFGKDDFRDPIVLQMMISPDNTGQSNVNFFGSLLTVDESGNEAFRRNITIGFEPAATLQITFIPRNARTLYEFGESAGIRTRISFRTEGGKLGLLDSLVYSIIFDPLPSNMVFDLNVLKNGNIFEFHYSCDRTYSIIFSLDSDQTGNLVKLELSEVPRIIDFGVDLSFLEESRPIGYFNLNMSEVIDECSLVLQGKKLTVLLDLNDLPANYRSCCGVNLGTIGDISASGLFDFEMSDDIGSGTLTFFGENFSFTFGVQHFPKNIALASSIDIINGNGNINCSWAASHGNPTLSTVFTFKQWQIEGGATLMNNDFNLNWDIDIANGVGFIDYSRSSDGSSTTFSLSITNGEWTVEGTIILHNTNVHLEWDIDFENGVGEIDYSRSSDGASSTLSASITKGEWAIEGTISLQNTNVHLSWNIDVGSGIGDIYYTRSGGSGVSTLSVSITNGQWMIEGDVTLQNTALSLSWNINIGNGFGYIHYSRSGTGGNPTFSVKITKGEWIFQGDVTLRNTDITLSWDIDIGSGVGYISYSRTSSGISIISGSITKTGSNGWTIQVGGFELKRDTISISWNINTEQREGYIHFDQNGTSEPTIMTIVILHNGWTIEDTLLLESNHHFLIQWDLPIPSDPQSYFNIESDTSVTFGNTISIKQGTTEVFHISGQIQLGSNFNFGWDYNSNNDPINFYLTGYPQKAINLYVKVNYNNFDFVFQSSWNLVESTGSMSILFNKGIHFNVVNLQKPYYHIAVDVNLFANRQISLEWRLIPGTITNPGYFLIDINGPNEGGSELSYEMTFDPYGDYDYLYGFDINIGGSFYCHWGYYWYEGLILPQPFIENEMHGSVTLDLNILLNGVWHPIL